MNTTVASLAYDSHFGPPSEPLTIEDFISDGSKPLTSSSEENLFASKPCHIQNREAFDTLTEDQRKEIQDECCLDELNANVTDTLKDPRLYAHARRTHEAAIISVYETTETNVSNRRKRKREDLVPSAQDPPELVTFREQLTNITLQSWPLPHTASFFIRGPKNSDLNPLTEVKHSMDDVPAVSQAILTLSVHQRIAWSHNFIARLSQHAMVSSQTLGDLFEMIPCQSNELPSETLDDDGKYTYADSSSNVPPPSSGFVICIEGVAYGDGMSEDDYADKLVKHLANTEAPLQNGPKAHDTPLSSLSVRLHQPYWLLHQGDCEHYIVFEELRLIHPSDPKSGYPLTLQITPPSLSLCRACTRVPAVYSIVGDIRLGESPCVLCAACWRTMGMPPGDQADFITVVPLPRHELGWQT